MNASSEVKQYGLRRMSPPSTTMAERHGYLLGQQRDRALELVKQIDHSVWELGKVLSEIVSGQLYMVGKKTYATFDDYCAEELGFTGRKGYFYAKVYQAFFRAGLGGDDVCHLGSTKCRLLARVVNKDNAEEWIKAAATVNSRELEWVVREYENRDKPSGTIVGAIQIPYHDRDTAELWTETRELVSKMTGCESAEAALEAVCQEFMSVYADGGTHDQDAISQAECSVYEVMNRAGWRCEVAGCGKRVTLESHHTLPRARYPELKDDKDLQVVLCHDCHQQVTDEEAELIQIGDKWALRRKT